MSFMRPTNAAVPPSDVRASTRAAALSDAMSARCSSSPYDSRSPARRYVVDAPYISVRVTATRCVRSGSSATNVTAVITFVRLAIDRSSCEFSSQSTSPVCGL